MALLSRTPGLGLGRPFRELERLRRQMDGVLESFSGAAGKLFQSSAGVYPLLNLGEDQENLYVTAELAGVAPADLDISVQNDNLIIRGQRRIPDAEQNVNYHRREREAGVFRRVVALPVRVDNSKVSAAVKNGVLKVTLPKAEEAKPRQVSIQAD